MSTGNGNKRVGDAGRRSVSVICPYADLRSEVRQALRGLHPRYVDVSDHEWAYWRLLLRLWERAETLVIVEHDVVPQPGTVPALLGCAKDWCSVPYRQGQFMGTGFGCTKFSGALMARIPDAVSRILPQHRSWNALDSMVLSTLRRNGEAEHIHDLPATHLHYDEAGRDLRPTEPRRSNASMMKLRYVGAGRYLNGIPARDFETDDPQVIAVCLGSGLYATLPEPAAPKRARPALEPEAAPEPVVPDEAEQEVSH